MRLQLPNSRQLLQKLRRLFFPKSGIHRTGSLDLESMESSYSSVSIKDTSDLQLDRKLNEDIRETFILYYYDNLLKNFFEFQVPGAEADFQTSEFIATFPARDRVFLEVSRPFFPPPFFFPSQLIWFGKLAAIYLLKHFWLVC